MFAYDLFSSFVFAEYQISKDYVSISVYLKTNHKIYFAGDMQNPAQAIKQYFEQVSNPF